MSAEQKKVPEYRRISAAELVDSGLLFLINWAVLHPLGLGLGADLHESEGKKFGDVDIGTLEYIHVHKTAALLEASVVGGANLGGATDEELARLQRFSRAIGLAFQIIDDVLDVTATTEELGKTAGKDLNADKTTFPKLIGLEASRTRADELIKQAKDELLGHTWKNDPTPLLGLADFITARKN